MTTKNEICQTIINKETGEVCGHKDSSHYGQVLSTGKIYKCWGWKNHKYCPCKKFTPKNHKQKKEVEKDDKRRNN